MLVSFTEENEPIHQPFTLPCDDVKAFVFPPLTVDYMKDMVCQTQHNGSSIFAETWSAQKRRCFWCRAVYDPWPTATKRSHPACPYTIELQNVLIFMEWWNSLPEPKTSTSKEPTIPCFTFKETTVAALAKVPSFYTVQCQNASSTGRGSGTRGTGTTLPSTPRRRRPHCNQYREEDMRQLRRDFGKMQKICRRWNALFRDTDEHFELHQLQQQQPNSSNSNGHIAWTSAIQAILADGPFLLDWDKPRLDPNILNDVKSRLIAAVRQLKAYKVLSTEPTKSGLERLDALDRYPQWQQQVQQSLHAYLTEAGNPPELLVAALNDLVKFEQRQRLEIQWTLLWCSVWKSQCVLHAAEASVPSAVAAEADEKESSLIVGDMSAWQTYKLEQRDSSAMATIVSLVQPFFRVDEAPTIQYRAYESYVGRRHQPCDLVWRIHMWANGRYQS